MQSANRIPSRRSVSRSRAISNAAFPPQSLAVTLLLGLAITAYFTISPQVLVEFGFNYEDTGGNIIEKIHPGTWLLVAAMGLAALYQRNPLSALFDAAQRHPLTVLFVATTALLTAHTIVFVRLPFTPFIDTFIAPILVFFLFKDLDDGRRRGFAYLVHALMAVNALLGLFEFASGFRLTPIVANGVVIDDDWRSSAFLGHPLSNASLTGAYVVALVAGGGVTLPRAIRYGAFALAMAGMVVFGGRASTVILLITLVAIVMLRGTRVLTGARFRTDGIIRALILIPLAATAIVVLNEAGFFDRFIDRFADDKGSADTRIEMFALFTRIGWYELLLVPDPAFVGSLQRAYGLDFGIESFWISFLLNYGALVSVVFFAGLIAFCADVAKAARPGARWVLLFFFLVASTSLSLSAKSPLFATLIVMITVLMMPPARSR